MFTWLKLRVKVWLLARRIDKTIAKAERRRARTEGDE